MYLHNRRLSSRQQGEVKQCQSCEVTGLTFRCCLLPKKFDVSVSRGLARTRSLMMDMSRGKSLSEDVQRHAGGGEEQEMVYRCAGVRLCTCLCVWENEGTVPEYHQSWCSEDKDLSDEDGEALSMWSGPQFLTEVGDWHYRESYEVEASDSRCPHLWVSARGRCDPRRCE